MGAIFAPIRRQTPAEDILQIHLESTTQSLYLDQYHHVWIIPSLFRQWIVCLRMLLVVHPTRVKTQLPKLEHQKLAHRNDKAQ
jgi:hypothetical protein